MTFIYIATRTDTKGVSTKIAGTLQARHSFEALHNARFEVMKRGGNIREMQLTKLA